MRSVEIALAEGVDIYVVAGDIADRGGFDEAAARRLATMNRTLYEAGIHVVAIDGNHDATDEVRHRLVETARPFPADSVMFSALRAESVTFENLGVALHGQSTPQAITLEDLSLGYPDPVPAMTNIGVLHSSLDGTRPGKPCAPANPVRLSGHGYDYWALGHVHQREIVETDPDTGLPRIVYAGNPQGRGPHESGPKSATIIDTDDLGRVASVTHHATASIVWATVDVRWDAGEGVDRVAERAADAFALEASALEAGECLAARACVTSPRVAPQERHRLEAALFAAADGHAYLEGVTWAARSAHEAPATVADPASALAIGR